MAAYRNNVELIGNVGADAEMRFTAGQEPVANIRLATTKTVGKGAEAKDYTEWHRLVCFGALAEWAGEYIKKGVQVFAEGELRTRKWEDKEGKDQYTTEIVAHDFQLLGKKPS